MTRLEPPRSARLFAEPGLHAGVSGAAGARPAGGLLRQGVLALARPSSGRPSGRRARSPPTSSRSARRWSRASPASCSGFVDRLGAGALRVPRASGCSTRSIDLPFALPTAVAGLVYSSLYVENGWLGQFLVPLGIKAAYSRLAVVLVLTFLGIPFVVRTLQPVLESLEADEEEAAYLLGASRWQTFCARDLAHAGAGADHGLCPVAGPRAGRIRLGRVRLGQHAVQDRDRAGADRGPARRVCLRRSHGDRRGAAGRCRSRCCWRSTCSKRWSKRFYA